MNVDLDVERRFGRMGVGRGSVVPLIFELEFGDGGWNVPRDVWIKGRIGTGCGGDCGRGGVWPGLTGELDVGVAAGAVGSVDDGG